MTTSLLTDIVNYIGLAAFALSGALMAVRRQFDIVGMAVLATITTLGGGVIRGRVDRRHPAGGAAASVVAGGPGPGHGHRLFLSIRRSPASAGRSISSMRWAWASSRLRGPPRPWRSDSVPLASIGLGVVTGIGGGILLDQLARRDPSPSCAGTASCTPSRLFWAAPVMPLPRVPAWIRPGICSERPFSSPGLRLLAVWRRWTGPVPVVLHR